MPFSGCFPKHPKLTVVLSEMRVRMFPEASLRYVFRRAYIELTFRNGGTGLTVYRLPSKTGLTYRRFLPVWRPFI